jgi:acetyl esterase/lipase
MLAPPERRHTVKQASPLFIALGLISQAIAQTQAQEIKCAIPYSSPAPDRQVLDVYSPSHVNNLRVVFWIHGGGWQTGDKKDVQIKPQAFLRAKARGER